MSIYSCKAFEPPEIIHYSWNSDSGSPPILLIAYQLGCDTFQELSTSESLAFLLRPIFLALCWSTFAFLQLRFPIIWFWYFDSQFYLPDHQHGDCDLLGSSLVLLFKALSAWVPSPSFSFSIVVWWLRWFYYCIICVLSLGHCIYQHLPFPFWLAPLLLYLCFWEGCLPYRGIFLIIHVYRSYWGYARCSPTYFSLEALSK